MSQCELRSKFPNLRVTNVIRIVTFYTLPPLESSTSSWMTRSQRSRRRDKGLSWIVETTNSRPTTILVPLVLLIIIHHLFLRHISSDCGHSEARKYALTCTSISLRNADITLQSRFAQSVCVCSCLPAPSELHSPLLADLFGHDFLSFSS